MCVWPLPKSPLLATLCNHWPYVMEHGRLLQAWYPCCQMHALDAGMDAGSLTGIHECFKTMRGRLVALTCYNHLPLPPWPDNLIVPTLRTSQPLLVYHQACSTTSGPPWHVQTHAFQLVFCSFTRSFCRMNWCIHHDFMLHQCPCVCFEKTPDPTDCLMFLALKASALCRYPSQACLG